MARTRKLTPAQKRAMANLAATGDAAAHLYQEGITQSDHGGFSCTLTSLLRQRLVRETKTGLALTPAGREALATGRFIPWT